MGFVVVASSTLTPRPRTASKGSRVASSRWRCYSAYLLPCFGFTRQSERSPFGDFLLFNCSPHPDACGASGFRRYTGDHRTRRDNLSKFVARRKSCLRCCKMFLFETRRPTKNWLATLMAPIRDGSTSGIDSSMKSSKGSALFAFFASGPITNEFEG